LHEKLINRIMLAMDTELNGHQLSVLKSVLTVECAKFLIAEQKNEVVIYDETSDIAAYKQFEKDYKEIFYYDGTYGLTITFKSVETNKEIDLFSR